MHNHGNRAIDHDDFDKWFLALTDFSPFGWQKMLFDHFLIGNFPEVIDLPTGLGKTSIIPIWLIALAAQAMKGKIKNFRRLVYIVNRRTVVDQATVIAEKICDRLVDPNSSSWKKHAQSLNQLRDALLTMSAGFSQIPLAVSTLRGELADNEEWKTDPTRPSIIVGTIDMIGSKLLFSGYGDGRYHRPHHAGLIGQDALIVHDEAHLTPAFSALLRSVVKFQKQSRESWPMQVLELSATMLNNNLKVLSLGKEDEKDKIIEKRLNARKRICFHHVDEDGFIEKICEQAEKHNATPSKVIVYVRSPELAQKVLKLLLKKLGSESISRAALLTGTIRGYERDRLVQENPVYRAFLDHDSKIVETIYLVSTSAGEVGIDLDADHMVCDLTTLDSMIQRLGRVNRRGGEQREAFVDVVVQKPKNIDNKRKGTERALYQATEATLNILSRLPCNDNKTYNGSPNRLRKLLSGLDEKEKNRAFYPKPEIRPLTDIMLDTLSLTSIMKPFPGRIEVAPFLHGLSDEAPLTYIVWRKEVALLSKARVSREMLGDWFRACRIETHERLRDRTDRVKKALQKLLKNHRKNAKYFDVPVILLDERGNAECRCLSEITHKDFNLSYLTAVLPVEAGGLQTEFGTLDGTSVVPQTDMDTAENYRAKVDGRRFERWLFSKIKGIDCWERLLTEEALSFTPPGLYEAETVILQESSENIEEDVESKALMLMIDVKQEAPQSPEATKTIQTLAQHLKIIEYYAGKIARSLSISLYLQNALVIAAQYHDRGKAWPVWQNYACNSDPNVPLAKSLRYLHGRFLGGYRHEFGSLIEAIVDDEIQNHPERDLILHLISAHHGWARPHFQFSTINTEENEKVAAEVMRRFGQLQQRFGRWGLAWLEALLRCADIAASKQFVDSTIMDSEEVRV